ncbi:SH3 domain-containing protein 2-like [Carex rostrata]
MESLRRQASKLREQVARQQQAVLKQFGGYGAYDNLFTDESEIQQHQRLEKLFTSTRTAKHFQRDIVRGVEGYIVTGFKQVETGNKLAEESKKYGAENTCTSGSTLSKAAVCFSKARLQIEKDRREMLSSLGQVAETLRAMVMGAPLEDARHLAQRYDRIRQEAEAQAVEVSKRQMRARESPGNSDIYSKLETAESKLGELKSNMGRLGKEAVLAMAAVEADQQSTTLEKLITVVECERAYHQKALQILEQLEKEMVSERQRIEGAPRTGLLDSATPPPSYEEVNGVSASATIGQAIKTMEYYLAEVIQSYQAESDVELNLSVGDFLVVRKLSSNGWAEGECRGKAGWFPSDYIERRERVLASKITHTL